MVCTSAIPCWLRSLKRDPELFFCHVDLRTSHNSSTLASTEQILVKLINGVGGCGRHGWMNGWVEGAFRN